jgi:hypothetical protein
MAALCSVAQGGFMPARLRVEDGIRDIGLSAIGESRTSPAMDRRRVRRDDGNGASLHEEEKSHHVEAGGRRDGMHAVQIESRPAKCAGRGSPSREEVFSVAEKQIPALVRHPIWTSAPLQLR